ncbi:MAG: hypothetical protein EAZ30_06980 [Betaproteobacteria bacterium]|nr:MAG: hypothetical protein EAZ43_02235 [Betaproteobacteria bacterium]TAG48306.1 MAG: hypothetical protein EAZ30_06980 [Betaproteobacteria bacterium]
MLNVSKRFTALIAASLVVLTACVSTQSPAPVVSAASLPSQAFPPPPVEPIVGQLLRESALFADSSSPIVLCTAQAGRLAIQRFKSGRYLVSLSDTARCRGQTPKEAWVNAINVDYADEALLPLLKRVTERPNLVIDMAYAGNKIFCDGATCKINEPLYGKARCYAAPAVADALVQAADVLSRRDPTARLRVLDCYRPIDVQIEMFKRVADPVWVAQPKPPRYGGHNRGVAIDLTVERDGVPIDMGSAFDAFSAVSGYDPKLVSAAAHLNRTLLRDVFLATGFRPYDAEWWHFSLPIDTRAMNFPL